MNKWQIYEQLKKELQNKNLTPKEYEQEIKKILKELDL